MKTVYNKSTFEVIGCEPNPKETDELGVTEMMCTENFIKACFNGEAFYEGADSNSLSEKKQTKISEIKAEARRKLLPTDWYVIRSLERNIPVPENISNARAIILADCDALVDDILNT